MTSSFRGIEFTEVLGNRFQSLCLGLLGSARSDSITSKKAATRHPGNAAGTNLVSELLGDGISPADPESFLRDLQRGRCLLAFVFRAIDPANDAVDQRRIQVIL